MSNIRAVGIPTCEICDKSFTLNKNLRAHLKKIHQVDVNLFAPKTLCNTNTVECIICKEKVIKDSLEEHFSIHNINLVCEEHNFSNITEFEIWKNVIEEKDRCQFLKYSGTKRNKDNSAYFVLHCSRSGFYKCEGKGLREIKTQGTKKLGGTCPAEMRIKQLTNGNVNVKFTKTHVGHDCELGHLTLTKDIRESVAVKLAAKIPPSAILDEVRDAVSLDDLQRKDLLTRKDINNIEKAFNINAEGIRHCNDAISVYAFVEEDQLSHQPCVLFYKTQGEESAEFDFLYKDDFLLVIMNAAQTEMLKSFGGDCICMDSTHGLKYNFQLTTILILDDLRQGFPCAFLISNRINTLVISVFLKKFFEQVGQIRPNVFMSDMDPSLYNAWCEVMGPAKHQLFCTWHVDKAWRTNVRSKIKNSDAQEQTYKILRTLLQETDQEAFTIMFENALFKLKSNPETKDFGIYFKNTYGSTIENWAFCHRVNLGLNTNMHIERMHRTIKYIYLKGLSNNRLDKSIYFIIKFIRDRMYDRLIILHKGKITKKISDLRKRHISSKNLQIGAIFQVEDGVWNVQSERNAEIYRIEKVNEECTCRIICEHCKTCIHHYCCSCVDSSIKWNMCKHIHLLCRYTNSLLI